MSLQSHIAELARRHQALDKEIQVVKSLALLWMICA